MAIIDYKNPEKYSVNRAGQEAITWSFYDFQTYPTAGASTFTFFQLPVGQNSKTLNDTNMQAAGALPAGQRFLIETIELFFYSGFTINTFNATASQANYGKSQSADVLAIYKSGALQFNIGSKPYLQEAPLNKFPPSVGIRVDSAVASNAAATSYLESDYATAIGRTYRLGGLPLYIEPTQNFNVQLLFQNGVVALPSGVDGRIGISLGGVLYRNSQ